jgi:hypothetical protein
VFSVLDLRRYKLNLPSVTGRVYGREGHASVRDLEVGLVLQHQSSLGPRWDSLRETDDGTMVNDSTVDESSWCSTGGEQEGQAQSDSGKWVGHDVF